MNNKFRARLVYLERAGHTHISIMFCRFEFKNKTKSFLFSCVCFFTALCVWLWQLIINEVNRTDWVRPKRTKMRLCAAAGAVDVVIVVVVHSWKWCLHVWHLKFIDCHTKIIENSVWKCSGVYICVRECECEFWSFVYSHRCWCLR